MTVYVKELKESFFTSGETLPYRTRQMVMGYFMDEESCWKDAESERDFYTSKNYYSDLFSNGKTIYMNTTIDGGNHYTKMTYSWSPISLLEVNHRGLNAEEFGAEEFDDMGFSLNMDRFSYQNEGKVRDIDGKELRQYRIYFGKEPMFYLNDAVFGYDNNNTVQGVVDDLNEALQGSIKEIFQRLLWKSQRPDSLDVMLRGEEFGAEMASLYDIVFEDDEGKKYTTHPDFDHSIINDMIEDDDLVPMDAEEFGAEGINLRKRIEDLIDLREINFTGFKKDTKREAVKRARRIENEIKGVLPKGKSYKVDKPKWFKIAQTGIVMGVAGLVGYSGFKNKE